MFSECASNDLTEVLARLATASPLVAFSEDVVKSFKLFETRPAAEVNSHQVVGWLWDDLPGISSILDDAVAALALAARAIWPLWYGELAVDLAAALSDNHYPSATLAAMAGRSRRDVVSKWVGEAGRLAARGQLPLPSGFSIATQAAQLSLAVEPNELAIVLAVVHPPKNEGRLLSLARAAEWLVAETGSRVLVILPVACRNNTELDSIARNSIQFGDDDRDTLVDAALDRLIVWPLIGRPHPLSPGELKLAQQLAMDQELADLFGCNQSVTTCLNSRYLVDLLWEEGKLVVEVDGFRFHSSRQAFSADRRRDYELTLSGYAVLRLPHDEVCDDVERAVSKIRDMVRQRRGLPIR